MVRLRYLLVVVVQYFRLARDGSLLYIEHEQSDVTSRLGRFDRLQDTMLPNGREWYAVYGSHDVTLGVVKG